MSAIPKGLTREHILEAIQEILRHGVPRNRMSTKHCLVYQGKHFPPKYIISLATKSLIPGGLNPEEFSGGPETNGVLTSLGFSVEDCTCGGFHPGGAEDVVEARPTEPVIMVARIDSVDSPDPETRLQFLHHLVDTVKNATRSPFLLVLPGGFLDAYEDDPTDLCNRVTQEVAEMLTEARVGSIVCLGVDGNEMSDQLGLAISRSGLIARARKFFPAGDETEDLNRAESAWSEDQGMSRVFEFGKYRFYIAICYDSFGIKKRQVPNQGADVILNLVHGFTRPPEPGCGSFYFARDGMVGAARTWGCPLLAASHFMGGIHQKWPTGVRWSEGDLKGIYWRYEYNPLQPDGTLSCQHCEEEALLSVYDLSTPFTFSVNELELLTIPDGL